MVKVTANTSWQFTEALSYITDWHTVHNQTGWHIGSLTSRDRLDDNQLAESRNAEWLAISLRFCVLLLFMFSCCASGVDSDLSDRLDFQVLLGQCCCLSTAFTVMHICTNTHCVCVCVCVCVCLRRHTNSHIHAHAHTCVCAHTGTHAHRVHTLNGEDNTRSWVQWYSKPWSLVCNFDTLTLPHCKTSSPVIWEQFEFMTPLFFFRWIVALSDTAALTMMSKVFSLFFFLRRVPSHCWENIPISGCMVFVSSGASMQKLEVCDFPRPALGKADQIYGLLWWSLASTSAQRQMVRRDSHCSGMALCIVRQDKCQHH